MWKGFEKKVIKKTLNDGHEGTDVDIGMVFIFKSCLRCKLYYYYMRNRMGFWL